MALIRVITVSLEEGRLVGLRSGTQLNPIEGEVFEFDTGGAITWAEVLVNGNLSNGGGTDNPTLASGDWLTSAAGQQLLIKPSIGEALRLYSENISVGPAQAGLIDIVPGVSLGLTGAQASIQGGGSDVEGGPGKLSGGSGANLGGNAEISGGNGSVQSGDILGLTPTSQTAGGIAFTPGTSTASNGSDFLGKGGGTVAGGATGGKGRLVGGDGPIGGDVEASPGNGATPGRFKIINPGAGATFTWPRLDGVVDGAPVSDGVGNLTMGKIVLANNARASAAGPVTNATAVPLNMLSFNFTPSKAGPYRIYWFAECQCSAVGSSFFMECLQGATVLGRLRHGFDVDVADNVIFTGWADLTLAAASQLYQIQGWMAAAGPTLSVERLRLSIERLGS